MCVNYKRGKFEHKRKFVGFVTGFLLVPYLSIMYVRHKHVFPPECELDAEISDTQTIVMTISSLQLNDPRMLKRMIKFLKNMQLPNDLLAKFGRNAVQFLPRLWVKQNDEHSYLRFVFCLDKGSHDPILSA